MVGLTIARNDPQKGMCRDSMEENKSSYEFLRDKVKKAFFCTMKKKGGQS